MPQPALEARALSRVFATRGSKPRVALDDINLSLPTGQVHAVLGPNGAGKTTLCRMACTVLTPSGGRLLVNGHDVVRDAEAVRRSVGIVFGGDRGLYGRLTVAQNLRFWCAMNGLSGRTTTRSVARLLTRMGLEDRRDDRVETLSRGYKQRVHLARGLVADPPIIILDEPTTGMDPVAAVAFRALMAELRAEGRTIFITTHDMHEAQVLSDTVTLIDAGRLISSDTTRAVIAMLADPGISVQVHGTDESQHAALLASVGAGAVVKQAHTPVNGSTITLSGQEAAALVLSTALAYGLSEVSTATPSLEDVYLRVFRRESEESRP